MSDKNPKYIIKIKCIINDKRFESFGELYNSITKINKESTIIYNVLCIFIHHYAAAKTVHYLTSFLIEFKLGQKPAWSKFINPRTIDIESIKNLRFLVPLRSSTGKTRSFIHFEGFTDHFIACILILDIKAFSQAVPVLLSPFPIDDETVKKFSFTIANDVLTS